MKFDDHTAPWALQLRRDLPKDLVNWRRLPDKTVYIATWKILVPLLRQQGLELWASDEISQYPKGRKLPKASSFMRLTVDEVKDPHTYRINNYLSLPGLLHAARNKVDSKDFMLKVMTAGDHGRNHLRIIRQLSQKPEILQSNNHILPIMQEIVFDDIVIGAFPLVNTTLLSATHDSRNSLDDMLNMFIQALEAITFIHEKRVAHRDLFLDNFLVEWMPRSLTGFTTMARPRVYLIDFETAIDFPEDSTPSERLVSGFPYPDGFSGIYSRPTPPELDIDAPYCPFKLDIWQFGYCLQKECTTNVPELDQLWSDLVVPIPHERVSSREAMERLDTFVRERSTISLNIPLPVSSFMRARDVVCNSN